MKTPGFKSNLNWILILNVFLIFFKCSAAFENPIEWNKTVMSAQEYEINYCFHGCVGNERLEREDIPCREPDCFPCNCEKPSCQIYGTCCPEISNSSDEVLRLQDNVATSKTSQSGPKESKNAVRSGTLTETSNVWRLTCEPDEFGVSGSLFVHSCPSGYLNTDVREMCESRLPKHEETLDSYTHVTDNETGVSYWNKYCATCHHISQVVQWDVEIECKHNLHVYMATSYEELLKKALIPRSGCKVSQISPDNFGSTNCIPKWFGEAISECNVTGDWLHYDASLEKECRQSQDINHRTYSDELQELYSNLFCYICNTNNFPGFPENCMKPFPMAGSSPGLPFSLLLNFDQRSSTSNLLGNLLRAQNCSDFEWRSPDSCLPLECPPGKALQGNNCSTALQDIKGLGYYVPHLYLVRFSLNMTDHDDKSGRYSEHGSIRSYLNALIVKIRDRITLYSKVIEMEFNVFHDNSEMADLEDLSRADDKEESGMDKSEMSVSLALVIQIQSYVIASKLLSRDDFERNILSELMSGNFSIDAVDDVVISVSPFSIISARIMFNCSSISEIPNLSSASLDLTPVLSYDDFIMWEEREGFLILTALMTCAHVKFNTSDYVLKTNNTVFPPFTQIVLYFDSDVISHIDFETEHELNQMEIDEDGTLKICEDILRSKVSKKIDTLKSDEDVASTMMRVQYILTLICISLSMVCVLLTLITYFLFPVLRSAAGQNNIFLCLTLLLAQASLLASSHVKGPSTFCTVLGISTHFLWLSMFCWSFTCCWNMFRVFTAKTRKSRHSKRSERMSLIKKVIFCTLVPVTTVIIVIVTVALKSNGERIGYGGTTCYLDSGFLVAVAMVTPLGLILLCNLFLFLVVVIKIHNVRKLQKHAEFQKDDRKNLYVYVKLSTLTGVFWGLSIVAEITASDTLRIISIILNGLQGVFIFLSYVCNKRVYHLYLRAVGMGTYIVSTSTVRSTLGRLASEVNPTELMSEDVSEKELSENTNNLEGLDQPESEQRKVVSCSMENCYVYDETDVVFERDEENVGVHDGESSHMEEKTHSLNSAGSE